MIICEKCEIKMESIPFGNPQTGAMGIPIQDVYYKCPECGKTEASYDSAANDLAQEIDKKILNKILRSLPNL
jgi:predicted RNA-binding Zn-ribbon protein involved in translation (DUF1610 family)